MGYTNKTSHYDLPQWIAGDKPSWLGDVNTAMLNIDTAIAGADASATAAESSAAAANAQVQAQEAKITKNTTDIQALTEQVANVSGVANAALPKNGGTMTGALMLSGAPTQDLQAATKKYVDDNSGKGALMLTGGTMTGPLMLNGDPTASLGAATKQYVDNSHIKIVPVSSVGGNISGFATSKMVLLIVDGKCTASAGSTIATIAGNPLGLTATKKDVGKINTAIGQNVPSYDTVQISYNGTNTVLTVVDELISSEYALGMMVWFNE